MNKEEFISRYIFDNGDLLSRQDIEPEFDEWLSEIHDAYNIAYLSFTAGEILKELAAGTYDSLFTEYLDEKYHEFEDLCGELWFLREGDYDALLEDAEGAFEEQQAEWIEDAEAEDEDRDGL